MGFYTCPELHRLGYQVLSDVYGSRDADSTALLAEYVVGAEPCQVDVMVILGPSDDLLALGLVNLFKSRGLKVAIQHCSGTHFNEEGCTAPAIEQMVDQLNKSRLVIYAPVAEQRMPRWLAWLLGYAEAKKEGRIAILPLLWSMTDQFVVDSTYAFYPLIAHTDSVLGIGVPDDFKQCQLLRLSEFLAIPNSWHFAC